VKRETLFLQNGAERRQYLELRPDFAVGLLLHND
jgi:hypothetical protein